jgi:hypothetical protein
MTFPMAREINAIVPTRRRPLTSASRPPAITPMAPGVAVPMVKPAISVAE